MALDAELHIENLLGFLKQVVEPFVVVDDKFHWKLYTILFRAYNLGICLGKNL